MKMIICTKYQKYLWLDVLFTFKIFFDLSRMSNIAFLMDWAQMADLEVGLIHQNISTKKASFHYHYNFFEKWQVVIKFLYL